MRRLAFVLLLSGTAAFAFGCGDDGSPTPPRMDAGSGCAAGERCGMICVRTETDPENCGSCGTRCGVNEACEAGRCRPAMDCPGMQIDCGGCVDGETSNVHCGRCGNSCNVDQECMGGSCVLRDCPSGQMRCGTACVDTMTDEANCGTCGTRCADGQECRAGSCDDRCDPGEMLCTDADESVCADLMTDPEHCGDCATRCMGGRDCIRGSCDCPSGTMACGPRCVDTMIDPANCGSCANACASGIMCMSGSCGCSGGLTLCGGSCVNTDIDNSHCGSCGMTCTTPAETCVSGSCMSACGPGTVMCGAMCTNLSVDPMNCGACGTSCMGGACVMGTCRPANDDRTSATTITLADAEVTVMGTTTNATRDGPTVPCICTTRGNVWYTFTLTQNAVVYFDTAGSSYDTSLFLTDSSGMPVAGQPDAGFPAAGLCNDDARCGSTTGGWTSNLQSRLAGRMPPGTYYLSVSGCSTGDFTLHAQRIPDDASFMFMRRLNGSGTTGTVSLNGPSRTEGTCGGLGSGEDQRWFLTCGEQRQFFSLCASDGGSWMRNGPMGQRWDPAAYVRSGNTGMQVVCNDDGVSMGGTDCTATDDDRLQWGSRINDVLVPRGLASVYVDSRTGGDGMSYRLVYRVR